MDGQQAYANSRSYCVVVLVRSAKNTKLIALFNIYFMSRNELKNS